MPAAATAATLPPLDWVMHSIGAQFRPDDEGAAAQLKQLQQYDPNASISAPDQDGFSRFQYDAAALPKVNGKQFNQFSSADNFFAPKTAAGAPFSLKNPGAVQSSNIYGLLTDPGNVNINEKVNNAQQRTMLDTIGPLLVGGIAGGGPLLNLLMKGFSNPGQNPLQGLMAMLQGGGQKPSPMATGTMGLDLVKIMQLLGGG